MESNLLSKIITITYDIKKSKIMSIFMENINTQQDFQINEANDDFWKGSINKIINPLISLWIAFI